MHILLPLAPFPYTVKKATYVAYRSKWYEHKLANVNEGHHLYTVLI